MRLVSVLTALAFVVVAHAAPPPPGGNPGSPTPGNPTPGNPTPGNPTPGNPTPGNPTPGGPGGNGPNPPNNGPQPTRRMSQRHLNQICPAGLTSCPVKTLSGKVVGLECIDTETTLDSCGGCASTGGAVDCSTLEGVADVECVKGQCIVSACVRGYVLYEDSECVPNHLASESIFGSAMNGAGKVFGY